MWFYKNTEVKNFTHNIESDYTTWNGGDDGIYKGDGSAKMPDTNKLYYVQKDFSIQSNYKENLTSPYKANAGQMTYRNGKWYRAKKNMDCSYGKPEWNGSVTINEMNIWEITKGRWEKVLPIGSDDKTRVSYVDDNNNHYVYFEAAMWEREADKWTRYSRIYLVLSTGGTSEIWETLSEKIIDGATNSRDADLYFVGHKFYHSSTIDKIKIATITALPSLPDVTDTSYWEELPMYELIVHEHDLMPEWRAFDNKNYNSVEVTHDIIYDNIKLSDVVDGVFFGNIRATKIEIIARNKTYTKIVTDPTTQFIKLDKITTQIDRITIFTRNEKAGIGTILFGKEELISALDFKYSWMLQDSSKYEKDEWGVIQYKRGIRAIDFKGRMILNNTEDEEERLRKLAIKYNKELCGIVFKQSDYEKDIIIARPEFIQIPIENVTAIGAGNDDISKYIYVDFYARSIL